MYFKLQVGCFVLLHCYMFCSLDIDHNDDDDDDNDADNFGGGVDQEFLGKWNKCT